jgi:hypothetical protein
MNQIEIAKTLITNGGNCGLKLDLDLNIDCWDCPIRNECRVAQIELQEAYIENIKFAKQFLLKHLRESMNEPN